MKNAFIYALLLFNFHCSAQGPAFAYKFLQKKWNVNTETYDLKELKDCSISVYIGNDYITIKDKANSIYYIKGDATTSTTEDGTSVATFFSNDKFGKSCLVSISYRGSFVMLSILYTYKIYKCYFLTMQ